VDSIDCGHTRWEEENIYDGWTVLRCQGVVIDDAYDALSKSVVDSVCRTFRRRQLRGDLGVDLLESVDAFQSLLCLASRNAGTCIDPIHGPPWGTLSIHEDDPESLTTDVKGSCGQRVA